MERYDLSDCLSVKGFPYYFISKDGQIFSTRFFNPKIGYYDRIKRLKQKTTIWGYKTVSLQHEKHKKEVFVHRLVSLAFVPQIKNKNFVNHKDGNKKIIAFQTWNGAQNKKIQSTPMKTTLLKKFLAKTMPGQSY